MRVAPDGSLRVEERIVFAFSGPFSGAYRDIPLRRGEAIGEIAVLEGSQRYAIGGCTQLGCDDAAGTFGVTRSGNATRIVWHYRASSEARTFTLRYRLTGVAVAYDDVVDVNLQVWGDHWPVRLDTLVATTEGPGRVVRAWGHPVWVRGDVVLQGDSALLRALDVPSEQFVELRVLYPRKAFTSTNGMRLENGPGLEKIAGEEQADADEYLADRERIDDAVAHPFRTGLTLLLLGICPAFLVIAAVFWRWGRDRAPGYDREYEQEPPSDTEPALVPALLRQGGEAGSFEFTATLFDLMRRGVYRTTPATTTRSTWGGLRNEEVNDLEVSEGDRSLQLTPWEANVADVVDDVLAGAPVRLSRFRDKIAGNREDMSERFTAFKANVDTEVGNRRWFLSIGALPLTGAVLVFAGTGALLAWQAIDGWRSVYPRWGDVVLIALAVAAFVNAAIVVGALTQRKLWRRASPKAALEAQRWAAFRRYLNDFPRLEEAPVASLALWERYLVYAIAFGIADRVLQAAHLHMPRELAEQSTIFWISPGGDLGTGATSFSIGDLSSGFGSALAPPSSGSGGFGGGFSGGGGFGGGGGGGGAW